jgi:hypothetical protein
MWKPYQNYRHQNGDMNNFGAENTQRVGATEQDFPARIYASLIQMLTEQDIRVGTGVSWLSV